MRFFAKTHEWIEQEGTKGHVGITHFAQQELGDIVYVQLPKVGQILKAGEEAAVLESTKAAADVYSPVSGKVLAVNEAVVKHPGLINQSAETGAWLFKIELSDPKEVDALLSREEYQKLVAS